MDPVPDQDIQLNGETLTRHEKAGLWIALQRLRIYQVQSLNENSNGSWKPEEIADGKKSVINRLENGSTVGHSLSSLGTEDLKLIQSALGYYVFNNTGCSKGDKRRARELVQRLEDLR